MSLLFICFLATILASLSPVGPLLLGILIPSLGVGTGYHTSEAAGLMVAFLAGSVWSSLVMLPWPESALDNMSENVSRQCDPDTSRRMAFSSA